jgi:hypothetical protein
MGAKAGMPAFKWAVRFAGDGDWAETSVGFTHAVETRGRSGKCGVDRVLASSSTSGRGA